MGSLKRKIKRNREKGKRKMDVEIPLVKEIDTVTVDEDVLNDRTGGLEAVVSERKVVVRDDGTAILQLLSQIDWNKPEVKDKRRDMTKVMRKLRQWNFKHSRREEAEGTVTVEWGQVEKLKKILLDDYPKDIPIQGMNASIALDEFEDWYDMIKPEMKAKEEAERKDDDEEEPTTSDGGPPSGDSPPPPPGP